MEREFGEVAPILFTLLRFYHGKGMLIGQVDANRVYSPIKNSRSKTGTCEANRAPSIFILRICFGKLPKSLVGSALTSTGSPSVTLSSRRFTTAGGAGRSSGPVCQVSPRQVQEQPVQEELRWSARHALLRKDPGSCQSYYENALKIRK